MERFAKIIDTPTTQVLVRIDTIEVDGEEHECLTLSCMSNGLSVSANAVPMENANEADLLKRLDEFDEYAALQFVETIGGITRGFAPQPDA